MQRDSLNIDPVVVLLSLAFWGAICGRGGHVPVDAADRDGHHHPGPVPRHPLDRHPAVRDGEPGR